jgi:two-component system, cell cycle sensor histidine kinase and response regulator CckA
VITINRPPPPEIAQAGEPLRVLVVEDIPADAELILAELKRAGYAVDADVVATPEELTARLTAGEYDVVLSDYGLRGWTAMDVIEQLRQHAPDAPLIVVTGSQGDEVAAACVKEGAAEYILKNHLTLLPIAIRRARAERALRHAQRTAETRYQMLFDSSPLPTWVFDHETHAVLAVNEAAVQHYGYAREEFLRMRIEDLRPPEDIPALHQYLEKMPAEMHTAGTWRHRTKSGGMITVEIRGHAMPWDGRPGELVVAHDVSDQRRAEQALAERASAAELGTEVGFALTRGRTLPEILRGCCDALVRNLDAAVARIWIVHEAEQMLELQASAGLDTDRDDPYSRVTVGQHKIGLIASERTPYLTNAVIGDPLVENQEWARREGIVAFAGYPLLVENRVVGVMAMFARHPFAEFTRDALAAVADSVAVAIERNHSEHALRESEQRFREMAEHIQEAFFDLDVTTGKPLYVSPTWAEIWGRPREQGYDPAIWFAAIHPEDRDAMAASQEAVKQGESRSDVFRVVRPDQTIRWVRARAFPVRDAAGRVCRVVGVVQDITDQRLTEQQLGQAQKMEAVGQLAGGVAHDFNNLLTAILGSAELLLETLAPDAPEREDVEEIHKAGRRAADLTRQLLAFSRQQVLAPRVLDLNELVANMEKLLQRLIGEDVVLRTALAPRLGVVRADPGQLEQVIVNLAVNARDAMPRGGQLTIETSNITLDEEYVEAHFLAKAGPYVQLTVTDTGTGMDAETKARMFEPFFTTKGQGKGTGLGLATLYGIVKQSDGNVWVYSEIGHGTAFKIYLPRVIATAEAGASPTESAAPRGTETVLVVEDDEQVRRLTRKMLEARGHTVFVAAGGAAALQLLETHAGRIDLLVTDVVMPGMSGRELVERVAVLRPTMKVLYLSGYTDDAVVRHGVLQAGIAFLQKPFAADTLVRKVREVIDGKA